MVKLGCKSVKVTNFFGNEEGGTDKPHKRETQILVGELLIGNQTDLRDERKFIDKCLLVLLGLQNMAYRILMNKTLLKSFFVLQTREISI